MLIIERNKLIHKLIMKLSNISINNMISHNNIHMYILFNICNQSVFSFNMSTKDILLCTLLCLLIAAAIMMIRRNLIVTTFNTHRLETIKIPLRIDNFLK